MRTITLEEHFASPGFFNGPGKELREKAQKFGDRAAHLFEQLSDLGDKRIAEMDAAGIDTQVLSLTSPGLEQFAAKAPRCFLSFPTTKLLEQYCHGCEPVSNVSRMSRCGGVQTIPATALGI